MARGAGKLSDEQAKALRKAGGAYERALAALEVAEQTRADAARAARADGATYEAIGEALGVDKSVAKELCANRPRS